MTLPRSGPPVPDWVPDHQRFRSGGILTDLLLRALVVPVPRRASPPSTLVLAASIEGDPPLLQEWLVFHRLIGVEHFLIYDRGLAAHRLPLLRARSDCTVIDWPYHGRRSIFAHACRLTARQTEWLAVLQDTHFLFHPERALPELLVEHAGLPALTVAATLFGTYRATLPVGATVIEAFSELAQPVSGEAERRLAALRGRALLWNQRFEIRFGLHNHLTRRLTRAAQPLRGLQLNQYLLAAAQDEGVTVLRSALPSPTDLLTSRGPYDGAAAAYVPAVRKALGLRPKPELRIDVPSDTAESTPPAESRREIVVLGMQHGAVTPIVQWLLGQLPEPWIYLHNQAPGRLAFRSERAVAECRGIERSRLPELQDPLRRSSFSGALVHSYLDVTPAELARCLTVQPPYVGRRSRRTVIVVVRDLINLYAVRLERARRRGWRGQLPVWLPQAERLRRCWVAQAEQLFGAGEALPNLVPLHSVQFQRDAQYRATIAGRLGLPAVAPHEELGLPLFDLPQNEEERSEARMAGDALTRWSALQDDAEFCALFDDSEVLRLLALYCAGVPPLMAGLQALQPTAGLTEFLPIT